MIIEYTKTFDTTIKYEPLIFHLWIINNSITLKIEKQDDRLRSVGEICYIQTDNQFQKMYLATYSCCEIAYHEFYLLGEKKYDNDLFSFNFKSSDEAKEYVTMIVNIFDNINIFDTTIYVHIIDIEKNIINTKIYGKENEDK